MNAQYFSKEDEQRELDELTEVEKESILDDIYGRKKKRAIADTTTRNRNDDIVRSYDDDLIPKLLDELENIPPHISGTFWFAWTGYEHLVKKESNLHLFLRCENNDIKKAALRVCEYWNMRELIFGDYYAFEPITTLSSQSMVDIVPYITSIIPNFCYILPNDDHGRTVICWDVGDIVFDDYDDDLIFVKICWFVVHMALQRESTQVNGVVCLNINQTSILNFPSRNLMHLLIKSTNSCLPIQIKCTHHCLSSLVTTTLIPMGKAFASKDVRVRLQIHNCYDRRSLLNKLQKFGLQRHNLPKSIGGNYEYEKPTLMDGW